MNPKKLNKPALADFRISQRSKKRSKTVETVKPVQHSPDNVNTYLSIMISAAYPNLKKTIHSSKELRNGLCCAHININGLYNKLDEIRLLLQESKFDLLAITETHLSEEIHKNTELCIDQYSYLSKSLGRCACLLSQFHRD